MGIANVVVCLSENFLLCIGDACVMLWYGWGICGTFVVFVHMRTFIFSLKLAESMCVLCVLLRSTSQRILNFSLQNLDNCRDFSMISLQFFNINIFHSFRGYTQFHSYSS